MNENGDTQEILKLNYYMHSLGVARLCFDKKKGKVNKHAYTNKNNIIIYEFQTAMFHSK